MKIERFSLAPAALVADTNIRYHYPINHGTWVVHPEIHPRENSFCRYELKFTMAAPARFDFHVSADMRFELFCDGAFIGMGPDRSDIEHWSFHSYHLELPAGEHALAAEVHYLYENHPLAQTSIEPGFVLYADDSPVDINTGSAPWQAMRLDGVQTSRAPVKGFFVVGPNFTIDAKKFFAPPVAVPAVVLHAAGHHIAGGRILPGWKLFPSRMPEQLREPIGGGAIRRVCDIAADAPFPMEDAPAPPEWRAFLDGKDVLTVPENTRTVVLWDLEQYHTAYPELTVSGGCEASVTIEWAESCFMVQEGEEPGARHQKGNRDRVAGAHFLGYGDTFLPDGPKRSFHTFWWRAGRYVRITICTRQEPLTLHRLRLLETRMPLENEGAFDCDDASFGKIVDLAVRGIQMCAHETYMDCPYYEQLMYVGDTRIQMLTAYVMSREDRLNQRGIELFDWSRRETGFVLERYPSNPKQLSTTFAMIWVLMLRDYAWWRDDPEFVRARMKGMRCLLEEFKEHLGDADLLPPLPGWSFMDWVDGLSFVNEPGPKGTVAAVVNLLLINSLQAAAALEDAFGEAHLAEYNRAWARRLAVAIEQNFWNEERGLFADDLAHTQWSEHAQCLALLSACFPQHEVRCFDALIHADDLLPATFYFSFYLLEVFVKFGRADLILNRFDAWREMLANGLKTPVEMPEPTRSDCHAWSSHPLFHMHASLAGIRPAATGFTSVRIAPLPGSLRKLHSTFPHPAGSVSLRMELSGGAWQTVVSLPPGVSGSLHWLGSETQIEGTAEFCLPVEKAE